MTASSSLIAQDVEEDKAEIQLKKLLGINDNNRFKARPSAIVLTPDNGGLKSLDELPESIKNLFDPATLKIRKNKSIIINNQDAEETTKKRNEQLLLLIRDN